MEKGEASSSCNGPRRRGGIRWIQILEDVPGAEVDEEFLSDDCDYDRTLDFENHV